ncbi:MAG TPA: site-specific integrase [Gemmata sp.]|nr:site-specific integrase [Gemmata sp.]
MSRPAKNTLPLADGREIAMSLKERSGIWRVQFADPDRPGRYREITTGKRNEREAWPEAGKIVLAAYSSKDIKPTAKTVTWDYVLLQLPTAATFRTRTLGMFKDTVNALRRTVTTHGPYDITPEIARRFRHLYATGTYTRSKREGAKEYTRSAKTVDNAIRFLYCLWEHLKPMGYAESNPWENVPRPTLEKKEPTTPTEEDFAHMFSWVDSKHWEVMSVFVRVKSLAGCRTIDLCQVRSSQFDHKARTLTITAGQDKTHRTRTVPLPQSLSARLNSIKGKTYLWESYTESIREHTNDPRAATEFTPERLSWAVRRLFVQYGKTHPNRPKIRPHDLRRRAITLTVKATGSVDAAAAAMGVKPETARRHYLDSQKAFQTEDLLKRMANVLLPEGK